MSEPMFSDDLDRRIAELVVAGDSNRIIGRRLGLPEGSVKWRLHRMYRRLDVQTRTQFALRLRELER